MTSEVLNFLDDQGKYKEKNELLDLISECEDKIYEAAKKEGVEILIMHSLLYENKDTITGGTSSVIDKNDLKEVVKIQARYAINELS